MLSVSCHISRKKAEFVLSGECIPEIGSWPYRTLDITVENDFYPDLKEDFSIFLTTQQAKDLADAIYSKLESEKEGVGAV